MSITPWFNYWFTSICFASADISWRCFGIQHCFFSLPKEAICKDNSWWHWGQLPFLIFLRIICFLGDSFQVSFLLENIFQQCAMYMMQVFREFFPTNMDFINLECVWESDKFVLHERMHKSKIESRDSELEGGASIPASSVLYQCVESFLGGTKIYGIWLLVIFTLLSLSLSFLLENIKEVPSASFSMHILRYAYAIKWQVALFHAIFNRLVLDI